MRRPSLDLAEPSRNLEESLGSPSSTVPKPEVDLSVPPSSVDIEAVEGSQNAETRIFGPPPHIAARLFYHPMNQTRRKDSAATSRRNSMSSAHSRSSHGCSLKQASAPQSKHVAQHLRRASILEDRKARLADRAAHAEKVRLRAAVAKAAARSTSMVSEERALAAAQARERNLAEITAACAEEVKRAKAVAESIKEKREQDIRKMKIQMEERFAEAERRREELRLRNSAKVRPRERGQSLMARKPALVEVLPEVAELKERETSPAPMQTDHSAAAKIQWWWRGLMRRNAVNNFSDLGLSVDRVRETSFEEVTELLSQEKVLVGTARVLRICGLREGDVGSVDEMAAVRSFLSAFLILGHPAQVLSNKDGTGEQEQVLVGKARDLLIFFETMLSRLTWLNHHTPPPTLFESFPRVYADFRNVFVAWKARDSNSLIDLMILQFVELDAILQTVKENTDGAVDEVYNKSIQDNQVLLLVRIKKLAGPQRARKMVSDAVKKARQARAKKRAGDSRPRVAEDSNDQSAVKEGNPSGQGTGAPCHGDVRLHSNVHIGKVKGLLPDNRVVVHELAINREFRVEPFEYRQQREHVLAPLFAGMRANMQADDQDGHFLLLLQIAVHIRDRLQRLVKPGTSMHAFIGEMLDTEMASRQFMMGGFSYEKFFQTMGALLPKLCAPVRDQEVKEMVDNKLSQGHYVERLEALMGFIDVMHSDYANYLLQAAAPAIVQSATPYETKMFAAALVAGQHTLSAATASWRAARLKVMTELARRDPEGINHARSRPTSDRIYNQMLVDVFVRPIPMALDDMPEMLRFDVKRAADAASLTRRILITGAILLQCKNLLKRDVRTPWKNEANCIMSVLEKDHDRTGAPLTDVDSIMAALEAGRSMPPATKAQLRALLDKFVTAGRDMAEEPREPVLRLLLARLRGHFLARLAPTSASDKAKAASTAAEKLASLGLAEFVDKVGALVDVMSRVGKVDRDAHGVWWDRVAEVVESGGAAST